MVIGANDGIGLEKQTRNSLVFDTFNFMLLTDDHSGQLVMLGGIWDRELFDIIFQRLVSFTNLTVSSDTASH